MLSMRRGSCAATQQLKNPTNCSFLTSDRARIVVALGSLETLALWETWVQSLGWEDPLEKETATLSSILSWGIPWKEKQRLFPVGWILQLLRGCTASAPHGEHEVPCGPILGMQQHAYRMSVFTYVQAYEH